VRIRDLSQSLDKMVRADQDGTHSSGIAQAISNAIQENHETGTLVTLVKLQKLRQQSSPINVDMSQHPRLDPRRVMRVSTAVGSVFSKPKNIKWLFHMPPGQFEYFLAPRLSRGGAPHLIAKMLRARSTAIFMYGVRVR